MPSDCKLKVGKKYTWGMNDGKKPTCECIFVGEFIGVMKYPEGREEAVRADIYYWEEVVEPRREFFNAYKCSKGDTHYKGPFMDRHQADINNQIEQRTRYGILELIHHSDTKVESIFHLTGKK